MEFKSITLSSQDLDRLLSIDNADERREVREFLEHSMANPESVRAEDYRRSSPAIYNIARRIERRVKSARRRAERKATPKTERTTSTATREETTVSCVVLASYDRILKSTLTSLNEHLDLMVSRFDIFEDLSTGNDAFIYLTDLRDRVKSLLAGYISGPRPDVHYQAAGITFPAAL